MISVCGNNLKMFAGDSGYITFNIAGLVANQEYDIYFQVNFLQPLILKVSEMTTDVGYLQANFEISPEITKVRPDNYTYGVKICKNGTEDTVLNGYMQITQEVVEGTING